MARRSDHSRDELHRMALEAARDIVRGQGLAGLTTRKIATAIGYTVGTLYQMFDGTDDLIEQMNAETLGQLYQSCSPIDPDASPADTLRMLADRLMNFTRKNPHLWRAIFEHSPPPSHVRKEGYQDSVRRLIGLVEQAISALHGPDHERDRLHEARVLWASLYGINALATSGRLSQDEDAQAMVNTLIELYVSARRPAVPAG